MNPLPDLRTADLGRGGILHQIVDRDGTNPAQPGFDVADGDGDVVAQAGIRHRSTDRTDVQQLVPRDKHVIPQPVDLVRFVAQHRVKLGERCRNQVGVRNPGAVESVGGFAPFVFSHLRQRTLGDLGVAPVRDERAHAADRVRPAFMAGADQQLGVRPHERNGHRDLLSVGHHEPLATAAVVLDDREDVVPAAGIQTGAVVAQLVQDFVHLERGRDGLDQDGGADCAVFDPEVLLREREHVVPQLRLEVRLELRQVEVWSAPLLDERLRVVEEVQPEIDQASGCRHGGSAAVDKAEVLLHQVPAARSHDDRRGIAIHLIALARGVGVLELAAHRVKQAQLAADHVSPGGTGGVLLVGKPDVCARVQRVDCHFRVCRASDLDATVLEAGAGTGDAPGGIRPDLGCLGQKAQVATVAEIEPALHPRRQLVVAAAAEANVQFGEELQCIIGQDFVEAAAQRARNLNSGVHCSIRSGCVPNEGDIQSPPQLCWARRSKSRKSPSFGIRRGFSGTARSRWSRRGPGSGCPG